MTGQDDQSVTACAGTDPAAASQRATPDVQGAGSDEERADRDAERPEDDEMTSPEERFVRDLEARGEVVPKGADLPPGATHEYVTGAGEGEPRIRRRRFSSH